MVILKKQRKQTYIYSDTDNTGSHKRGILNEITMK